MENSESWNDVFLRGQSFITKIIQENIRKNEHFEVFWSYDKIIKGEEFLKNVYEGKYTNEPKIANERFKKFLLISHGQFIRELLSNILAYIDGNIVEDFIIKNATVNSIKIYCPDCNGKCTNDEHKNLIFSFSFFQDKKL